MLSRFFLKERLTLAHFIAILFTACGVVFISKPSFIFPKHPSIRLNNLSHMNCSLNLYSPKNESNDAINASVPADLLNNCDQITIEETTLVNREMLKTTFGILMVFFSALASSCVYLVLKKLCKSKVHWAHSTIAVCWFGIPFSVTISFILIKLGYYHENFEKEVKDLPMDLFYSIVAAILSLCGQILLNIALKVRFFDI